MQIVDAIKNLTVAMKGSGTVDDIDENQIADCIQYIADCIQYIADNWSTIKKTIQGSGYTLPAASKTTLGGVKQAARVNEAEDANVTKAEFKALLDALKAAGIMASA